MVIDLSMELIQATVQLEQPLGNGTRTVGTGFLISAPGPNGAPRTVLVTASHVLDRMPGQTATIGFRIANPDGSWSYSPQPLQIRDATGGELWTHHPSRDVAAMTITAPAAFARAAIPVDYLATDETFANNNIGAGDEMMALGFPRGLAANPAGFPILRSGRVASFPVAPSTVFPTFLLDFAVFPGNSGGPVFVSDHSHRRAAGAGGTGDVEFIAGLLTQEVELGGERLEIGIVTHAAYIRQTIDLIGRPAPRLNASQSQPAESGARAASAGEARAPD